MTPKQADALRFIDNFINENGFSPSYDEIAASMGVKSRSGTHRIIHALVAHGKLKMVRGRNRSLEVIK